MRQKVTKGNKVKQLITVEEKNTEVVGRICKVLDGFQIGLNAQEGILKIKNNKQQKGIKKKGT